MTNPQRVGSLSFVVRELSVYMWGECLFGLSLCSADSKASLSAFASVEKCLFALCHCLVNGIASSSAFANVESVSF